jgi:hypothetical protein
MKESKLEEDVYRPILIEVDFDDAISIDGVRLMPKIREVKCCGFRVDKEGKKKARYVYTRKAYYFPVAFEKQLSMFKGVELHPHLEDDKIVLEARKRRAQRSST